MQLIFKMVFSTNNLNILIKAITHKNHIFKLVGGSVRNFILKTNTPCDFDIASNFLPQDNLKLLETNKIKSLTFGIDYGTITAVINKECFEITTLRKDISTNGRKAIVAFTKDFYEDALRRDFTFNAIYLDPITFEITDYFNGIQDLHQGNVAFIGNPIERINEDFLRILRFFRFYNIYGKHSISVQLLDILTNNSNKLKLLSKERLNSELFKILSTNNPFITLKIMIKANILGNILSINPEIINFFENLTLLEKELNIINPKLRFVFLINNKQEVKKLILCKKDIKELEQLFLLQEFLLQYRVIDYNEIYKLASFYGINQTVNALIINATKRDNLKYHYLEIIKKLIIKNQEKFPITGEDIKALGIKEGKKIGEILNILKTIFLQEAIQNKEFYLEKAKKIIHKNT